MSSKIRVLTDLTINKIAAGEVIENPASVIKELVENSLDAGATKVCVEIKGGGRQLIRVSDNGCGMSKDDALLCLERHATSKIRHVEDIQSLVTMGFRGEALPSIASISKFTLLTCLQQHEQQSQEGTMVIVEGGQILSCTPAVRSPGTTIEVKSLFFNVPVRKKFQKSPTYDTQEILKILGILALGHPTIDFELISDQKILLDTRSSNFSDQFQDRLRGRIEAVLGRDFFSMLYPVCFHKEPYRLEGYIGLPTYNRHNRTGQYLYVNQRAVQCPTIAFAIREGYGTALPTQRHPLFVLHFAIPGSLVDVNVHPQKKEIRLRQELTLRENIMQAIQATLHKQGFGEGQFNAISSNGLYKLADLVEDPKYEALLSPLPDFSRELNEIPQDEEESPNKMPLSSSSASWPPPPLLISPPSPPLIRPKPTNISSFEKRLNLFQSLPKKTSPRVLATSFRFILIDPSTLEACPFEINKEGLCLVDQRGAHARIQYERLLKQLTQAENAPRYIQPLLVPLTFNFSLLEAAILKENLAILNRMGFGIQEFGEHTFIVDAIPDLIKEEEVKECLTAIIQDIQDLSDTRRIQREKEKQIAMAACRAAKATTKHLAIEEAQALINQLFDCDNPFYCPMGNGIVAHLSTEELLKYFQR